MQDNKIMKKMLFLILISVGAVLAQGAEEVHQELKRTDEVIQRARLVIEPANNPDAQAILTQAIEIQNSAWDGYRRKRYRWAYSRTLAARQRAREAMELVGNARERVAAEIGRTEELMNEAGSTIIRLNEPRARELWQMAQSEQATARNYFSQRRFRLALRFTIAARNHLLEVLGMARQFPVPEKVKAEVERTDWLLQQAAEPIRLSNNTRAQEMFARAGEWQVQARVSSRVRLYGKALKLTFASRDLMFRAWGMVKKSPDTVFVESAVSEADHLIAQWSERINQEGDAEIKRMLEQAISHQKNARNFFSAGDLPAALLETNLARRLLNRAIELIQSQEPTPVQE
ncbi:MAG: hypothetical protein ACUVUR_03735 [bacterium]